MSDDWRQQLKSQLCNWVDDLPGQEPTIEPPDSTDEVCDEQAVWSAIIALESHTRKHAQKVNSALQAFSAQLQSMQTGQDRQSNTPDKGAVLLLAGFAAQLERLAQEFASAPKAIPFGLGKEWPRRWGVLAQSVAILQRQLDGLMHVHGIRQEAPQSGDSFDPAWMEAVEIVAENAQGNGNAIVQSVFEPAYFSDQQCIRPAKISISR